jgi:hypothetical protein
LRHDDPDSCWHRGTQEIDIMLGSFAETSVTGFDSAQLDRFEASTATTPICSIGSTAAARRRPHTTTM